MRVGVIGTGLMGSSIARCLAGKGYDLVLYNRTRSKAERVASITGGVVVNSPLDAAVESDVLIVFVTGDEALRSIVYGEKGLARYNDGELVVLNNSTITPMTSLEISKELGRNGIGYLEAPVYGSVSEAENCRLVSLIAGDHGTYRRVEKLVSDYSSKIFYLGEIPTASVVKLALNNIGLALPALLAESLSLLIAWGIDPEEFLRVAGNLWFGEAVKRYWKRIMEEKPPRFKVWMAGKDYEYVARSLKAKKQPALISQTISSMYYLAALNGYMDKDYPQVARYYLELAGKTRRESRD